MHVLVTADTIGGVWTYTKELVTGLTQRGAHVTLVSVGEIPTPQQAEWLDGVRNVDFHPTAFRLEWMQEAGDDLAISSEYLQDIIHDTKPDLLHLNQYCYGALPVSIPKVVVAHSDVVSWWMSVHNSEPPENRWTRFYRETVMRGLLGANFVVAPSRWMLEQIRRYYLDAENASVIYNGRNPGMFNPHMTKEDLVVAVGRVWDGGKQVSLLMEEKQAIPVWLAGSEDHPEEHLRNHDLTQTFALNGVRFCGRQSESQLRQIYARASMYAATSRYEPFGLAPLEAALSRCVVVANDIPAFREIWGDTACYFRTNDPRDLALTIERLQNDREMRLKYANLAYQRARQRYTADRMVTEYVQLYESLVPAGAAAA